MKNSSHIHELAYPFVEENHADTNLVHHVPLSNLWKTFFFPASVMVLEPWSWQDSSLYLRKFITDSNSEFLSIRILMVCIMVYRLCP